MRTKRTIQELIDQDEIVLDGLLIKLAKVPSTELNQAVEELKDQRSIGVTLGDSDEIDVFMFDMAESRAAEGKNRRSNLSVGNDLNAEYIGETWSTVVTESAEDEVLSLLIEDEHTG